MYSNYIRYECFDEQIQIKYYEGKYTSKIFLIEVKKGQKGKQKNYAFFFYFNKKRKHNS